MASSRDAVGAAFDRDVSTVFEHAPRWHSEGLAFLSLPEELPEYDRLASEYVRELIKFDTAE